MREGGSQPDLTMEVAAVEAAAAVLRALGDDLTHAREILEPAAVDGLGGIAPSDLFHAYAFCWGRWAWVLDQGAQALTASASLAAAAAGEVRQTDLAAGGALIDRGAELL